MTDKPILAEIPAEKLGPPGIRGTLFVVAQFEKDPRTDQSRLHDTSRRRFKVAVKLSRSPQTTDKIRGDFGQSDGGSFLLMTPGGAKLQVQSSTGTFHVKQNNRGELSLIEFECDATSITEARHACLRSVLPLLDYLVYISESPLFTASLRIEDVENKVTMLDYVSPYQAITVHPHLSAITTDLKPVYAMYREAKDSPSDFYKFLCYYKILEGLLGPLRARLFKEAKQTGIKLPQTKDVIPSSPHIPDKFKGYVNGSVKAFFDAILTPQYRNAVAHLVTDTGDILDTSDPEHLDRYSQIVFMCELCTRVVITNHETLVNALRT